MDRGGGNNGEFKLYGVLFDSALRMDKMVDTLKARVNGKIHALFKIRNLYTVPQMFRMYKAQVLPTVEWCTSAIFHCTKTLLDTIANVLHIQLC